jgi:hypothetical protein
MGARMQRFRRLPARMKTRSKEGGSVSRSAGWFRVITCRALMRLAHGSSTLYFHRLQHLSLFL